LALGKLQISGDAFSYGTDVEIELVAISSWGGPFA
jgi:hypothetical protein